MSDEATPELSAIDLSLSFAPAWAKDSAPDDKLKKLAARHDRDDSRDRGPRRGPHNDRGDRNDRGRRPDRDRGPRKGGGGRRDQDREERAPRKPEITPLTGWQVQFLPDKAGIEGLAKQIRTTAKAYPLFDLAQLVLEKSERYVVEFKKSVDSAPALYQLKSDETLWTSEREAIAHALSNQRDKFYRTERVSVDPPKGVFPFVAQCGLSGVLLGPPNYHDYQSTIIKLHAERFSNMSFDAFKSRIRMLRDEESIAKWKDERSAKEVYFPIEEEKPVEPATEAVPEAEEADPAVEVTIEAEMPVEETVETPEPPADETIPAEPSAAGAGRIDSLPDLEKHFREHYLAKNVIEIRKRVVLSGSPAMNSSSPAVHLLAREAWEELRRFPLPIANTLGQQLGSKGVQIFKGIKKHTYAGIARPKFLDHSVTPISTELKGMLTFLEENTKMSRAEQWKALVALRPAPVEGQPDRREHDVAADLSWLLHEGHVVDYAQEGFLVVRRPGGVNPPKGALPAKPAPVVLEEAVPASPAEPPVMDPADPVAETPIQEVPPETETPSPAEVPDAVELSVEEPVSVVEPETVEAASDEDSDAAADEPKS